MRYGNPLDIDDETFEALLDYHNQQDNVPKDEDKPVDYSIGKPEEPLVVEALVHVPGRKDSGKNEHDQVLICYFCYTFNG